MNHKAGPHQTTNMPAPDLRLSTRQNYEKQSSTVCKSPHPWYITAIAVQMH